MKETNDLSTLSSSGVFEKLEVVDGELPSPRSNSVAWTYKGDVYFAFGKGSKDDVNGSNYIRGGEFVEFKVEPGKVLTNQVIKYDPNAKRYSSFPISGSPPQPLVGCAIAKVDSRIFIHGFSKEVG